MRIQSIPRPFVNLIGSGWQWYPIGIRRHSQAFHHPACTRRRKSPGHSRGARPRVARQAESFLQVLLMARELKLVRVGLVSVDGTKMDANASKHRSVRYDRAKELVEQLWADIDELLSQAEQADSGGGLDTQMLL